MSRHSEHAKRRRLGISIIAPVAIAIILAFSASTVLGLYRSRQSLNSEIFQRIDTNLLSVSLQLDRVWDSAEQNLSTWISLLQLDSLLNQGETHILSREIGRQFQIISRENAEFDTIILRDLQGRVIATEDPVYAQREYINDQEYRRTTLAGNRGISSVERSMVSGTPVIAIAVPVISSGQVVGTLEAAYKLSYITRNLMDHMGIGDSGYSAALDTHLRYISHPDFQQVQRDQAYLGGLSQIDFMESSATLEYRDAGGVSRILRYLKHPESGWILAVDIDEHELLGELENLLLLNIVIAIISLFVILAILLLTIRVRINPIKEVSEQMAQFAGGSGDLTVRLPISRNDEIGTMVQYFNNFVQNQGQIIHVVQQASNESQLMGGRVEQKVHNALHAARQIRASSSDIRSNMTELTEGQREVQNAVARLDEVNSILTREINEQETATALSVQKLQAILANLDSLQKGMSEREETVRNLYSISEKGAASQRQALGVMDEVLQLSDAIRGVSDIIKSLASQTNLLSMNAAIEAAHAGDSGRGFAVVAEEIRKLAEDSSRNSSEIDTILKNIVGRISMTSSLMTENSVVFEQIFSESGQVVRSFSELFQAFGQLNANGDGILTAVQTLRGSSRELQETQNTLSKKSSEILQLAHNTFAKAHSVLEDIVRIDGQTVDIQDGLDDIHVHFEGLQEKLAGLGTAVCRYITDDTGSAGCSEY